MHFSAFTTPLSYHIIPSIHLAIGLNEETGKVGHPMITLGFLHWNAVFIF